MTGPLPPGAIEHFRRHGYVHLRQAFTTAPESLAARWVSAASLRVGTQQPIGPVSLPPTRLISVADFAPGAWASMGQLVGGLDRLQAPAYWSDAFLVQEALEDPHRPVAWHVDGDFFRHFLDSPEQALLVFVLWTDVGPHSGPTRILPESVAAVARFLARHPEGVEQMQIPADAIAKQCRRHVDVTGDAGDVWLLHPFMVHGSLPCSGRAPRRIISNPVPRRSAPLCLSQATLAPVEQAILDATGVASRNFSPQRERRTYIPQRVQAWAKRTLDSTEPAAQITNPNPIPDNPPDA